MQISIISVFPELYQPFLGTSLISRAIKQGTIGCQVQSFFKYVEPKERIDAPTFGHGAGMLIRPEVVERAVQDIESVHGIAYKIFFSPAGTKLDQKLLEHIYQQASEKKHIMLLPARYEGMDARVEAVYADQIISVGDFVLMGGDIPAMMFLEGMLRLLPGVVGKYESVTADSFFGPFVDYPEFCAPVVWKGLMVPEVVRQGDHGALAHWRRIQSVTRTLAHHFSWLRTHIAHKQDKALVLQHVPPHYVVLMHSQVMVGPERTIGTTSVTSIDIHDISRSSRTYGIQGFFVVTPLVDQQKIVTTFLDFWNSDVGIEYNQSRHNALQNTQLASDLEQVIDTITAAHGANPLLITTAARHYEHIPKVTYHDQSQVFAHNRPVLIILGTGRGLAPELLERADYMLIPVEGLSEFNHLSVRSAAAIILDRWLGINPV